MAAARDRARPWLAIYLGGMGAREKNFYVEAAERFGEGESARRVQELFLAGDREAPPPPSATGSSTRPPSAARRASSTTAWRSMSARADTLLALPFGDRPATVKALA